jgi:hypothetical protein
MSKSLVLIFIGLVSIGAEASTSRHMQRALLGFAADCNQISSSWTPSYSDIVGYWKLDEAAGAATVADSSTNASTGSTLTAGVTLGVPGKMGTAASFNGSTGSIDIGSDADLKPSFPVTMSAWVKPAAFGTASAIFSLDEFSGTLRCGLHLFQEIDGTPSGITGQCNGATFASRRTQGTTQTLNLNRWNHFAVVFTNNTSMKLYINGAPAPLKALGGTGASMNYGAQNGKIGGQVATNFYNGSIDEVILWKVALNDADIRKIYEKQSCGRN